MQEAKKILSDFHEMTVTFPPTQNYKLHSGQKMGTLIAYFSSHQKVVIFVHWLSKLEVVVKNILQ